MIVRLDKKRVRSRLNRNTVRGEDEFIVTPSFDKARPSDRVWQVKRSSRGTVVEQGLTKPEAIGRARDILRDEGIALTPEETVLLDRAVEREIHRRFKDIHQRRRMEASRPGASESPAPPLEPGPEGSPIPRQIETTPTTKEIESDAATAAGEGREIEANLTRDEPISEAETEFIAQNTIEGEPKLKDAITRIEACIKKNIGR